MTIDPSLVVVAATAFTLTILGLLFDYLKQSALVAYLLAGVLLGPFVVGVFQDPSALDPLAGMGLVTLLFFIGLEVDLRQLTTQWRVAVIGTLLQTGISVGLVWAVAHWLDWPLPRIVLMGFVITLSSTPIALRFLDQRGLLGSRLGANTLGILVAQDLLAIPMLIVLGLFQGETPSPAIVLLQVSSAILVVGIIMLAVRHSGFRIPLSDRIESSRELQVLAALGLCFGTALITGLMQLSVVLGGFVAGLLIRLSNSLPWVRNSLEPFNLALVAVFFVSIGVLIDVSFVLENLWTIAVFTLLALLINTIVNMGTLIVLGEGWRDAIIGGASLAQLGEFGFVLAALGLANGVIGITGYQYVLAVTALSWIVSPLWIVCAERLRRATLRSVIRRRKQAVR